MSDGVKITGENIAVRYQDEHVQFEEYLKDLEKEEEEFGENKKKQLFKSLHVNIISNFIIS